MSHNPAPKKSGFNSIRIACRKKMIDLGYDRTGSTLKLAEKLGVNYQALSMALTGYRDSPRSIEILTQLRTMLDAESSNRGSIHNKKQTSNQIHRRLSA